MDWDNSSSGNITTDASARDRKQEWVWIHFTAINAITLVAVAGNVLVITVISQTRSLHTATSVFIVTLSISDLCTSLTVMLPSGIALASQSYQSYQEQFCDFLGFCYIQFRIASIYALSSISVERCTAIQVPLKYTTLVTRRRTTVTVVLIWTIPCIMATLPFLLNMNFKYSTLKGLCVPNYKDNFGYTLTVLCGGVCIPLLVTLVMYCCIARVALKQARKGVIVCDENHCQYVSSRKGEFKAVKTLCAITGVFFLCWLPYTITNLWSSSTEHIANVHWDITCEVLTFLSAALNPCLYSLLNRTFRQALVRTQKRLSLNISECCLNQSNDARNGQVSNKSKVNSHATQTLQENGKINKNQNEITILSVTKLKGVESS